jgi:hypothetical protein
MNWSAWKLAGKKRNMETVCPQTGSGDPREPNGTQALQQDLNSLPSESQVNDARTEQQQTTRGGENERIESH